MGTRDAYRLEEMAGGWAAEKSLFRPGIFPDRQHQRQLDRRRPLHPDDLEGDDPGRLRRPQSRMGFPDLPLFSRPAMSSGTEAFLRDRASFMAAHEAAELTCARGPRPLVPLRASRDDEAEGMEG